MIILEEKVEIVEEEKKQSNIKNETSDLNTSPASKKHLFIYLISFIFALFLILLIIFLGFTIYNKYNSDVISQRIYVCGIDVSGLSKSAARSKLLPAFEEIQTTDIHLHFKDNETEYETYINSEEIGLKFDIDAAINYAFQIGKTRKYIQAKL